MISLRKKSFKVLVLAILVFIIAVATYGFAAANTINGGTNMLLGEGSGTIAGYAVTNISYGMSTANPHLVTEVQFDTDATASVVYAALNGGTWSAACTDISAGSTGDEWECTFGAGVSVGTALSLEVFATDQSTYTP